MNVQLDIQLAVSEDDAEPPSTQQMQRWVELALAGREQDADRHLIECADEQAVDAHKAAATDRYDETAQ